MTTFSHHLHWHSFPQGWPPTSTVSHWHCSNSSFYNRMAEGGNDEGFAQGHAASGRKSMNSDFWLLTEYSASLLRAVSPLILTKCSPYLVVWTKRLCPSKKLICWSPNSQCFHIWRWGLCELIRIRRGHVGRALAWQNYRSCKKRASPCACTKVRSHEHTVRWRLPIRQEKTQNETYLAGYLDLAPDSLQNCEKWISVTRTILLWYLSWQSKQTNIPGSIE